MTKQSSTIKNLNDDIKKHYIKEYFNKQTKEQKGFWGGLNRFFNKFSPSSSKENASLERIIFPGLAIVFLSQLAGLAIPVAIVTPIALPLMFGIISLSLTSYAVTTYKAKKLIKEDAKSGLLLKRYNAEVLKPESKKLSNNIKSLHREAQLKLNFNRKKESAKRQISIDSSNKHKPKL